ncbi:MAG TPA: right-handed parallel beta-helix repeat-containing protein, partial [Polyangiales bacterium]
SSELWVDAKAKSGGSGSTAAPFGTLTAAIAAAGPGVDIHVRAGTYRESVTITAGGAADRYLRVLGEAGAVLDGSAPSASLSWTSEGSGVFSTPWSGDPRYVSRDGARLYHYLSLADLRSAVGNNAEPIAEGFFVDSGKLYVHSADAPSAHAFQIPVLNTALQLTAAAHVWIEGLEIRFYGEADYGKGIDITEASSDVVVRNNHIHDIPTLVWVRKGSSAVRIEGNELHQSSVFAWPWDAVKATDHENDAITLAGGEGAIVAHNFVHDVFNGVYAGSFDDDHNPALAFDTDVYENRLTRIGDDGFEPEGADVNARFWGNALDVVHNGVSLAPITYGPVWVVRNRFTSYQESGFKVSNDSSGRVWLLHNTCFTDQAAHNGMNVSGAFTNIVFRNNVIRGTSYSIESTQVVSGNDLDYDALFTTRGAPRVKWNDVRYDDVAALCSATKLECHGVGADPALQAPATGHFGPSDKSPLIDAALRLYGINDAYTGAAPDIGYVERGGSELPAP